MTDNETGEPLAELMIVMIPMRSDCGWVFRTRTDADGRYRVSGHGGAGTYITTVYPPADSGYLAAVARSELARRCEGSREELRSG